LANDVISYLEMCQREGTSLQRGMNFGLGGTHSVVLMSVRTNAPYEDQVLDEGTALIYEGHDEPRSSSNPDPKKVDQPEFTSGGSLTQNGLFHRAAQAAKKGLRPHEVVRVCERLRQGMWSYNGTFCLVNSWRQHAQGRQVFKFRLLAVEDDEEFGAAVREATPRRRVIPTAVKLEVWKRDGGKCVMCGATGELHFGHIVPYSKGGTSLVARNVQLLCARHNLAKHDRIE
jgi:5-methylcytosine-specific restriction endonuclease McrA